MKLENQVCTREKAEKLKELGIAQDALFYHTHSQKWGVMPRKSIDFSGTPSAAFTVAELGIMLQARFQPGHSFMDLDRIYWYHTWQKYGKSQPILGPYDSEAEARAAMLIHLLETKYLTTAEVNARLEKEGGA